MRRTGILTIMMVLATLVSGCFIAIGTERYHRNLPSGSRVIEIDGVSYVADLDAGTIRPLEEIDD